MRVHWLPPLLPFGQAVFLALCLILVAVALVLAKDRRRVLLMAAVVTGAWQGGLWLARFNTDIRLTHIFLFGLFVWQFIEPQKQVYFRKQYMRILLPWSLLIIWSALAITQALNTDYARMGPLTFLIDALAVYVMVSVVRTPRDLQFFLVAICFSVIGQSVLALVQFKFHFFKLGVIDDAASWMWWRARGSFFHPNHLGIFLASTLPLVLRGLIGAIAGRDKKMMYITSAAFLLGGVGLLATFNRGSWVGLAAGLLVMVFMDMFGRGGKVKKVARGMLVAGILVAMAGSVKYGALIIDRFINSDRQEQEANRSMQAEEAIALIKQKPLLGVGYKNDIFYSSTIFVHNNYLLIAAETGLVGLGFFLWFLFEFWRMIVRSVRSKIPTVSNYGKGYVAGIIAFMIASIPGPDFWINEGVQMHFFVLVAFMISMLRIENKLIELQRKKKREQRMAQQAERAVNQQNAAANGSENGAGPRPF